MKNIILFVLLLIFVSSCTHTQTKPAPRALTWSEVMAEQKKREEAVQSLIGKMSVEFDAEKDSVRGLGTCGAQFPDNFLLEIRDPVGRLHFQAVNRGNKFEGYFPRLGKLYKDTRAGRNFFTRTWDIPVSFKELYRASAGLLPRKIDPSKMKELTWNGQVFVGQAELEDGTLDVEIRADEMALSKLVWQRKDNAIEIQWRDFRPCCDWAPESNLAFAHVIEVKSKDNVIAIDWKSLQKWETASEGKFTIQASNATKVIPLD